MIKIKPYGICENCLIVFVDPLIAIDHIASNPDHIVTEIYSTKNYYTTSGNPDIQDHSVHFKTSGNLYSIQVEDNNLTLSHSGIDLIEGFLPISGGTITGDLILDHDPLIDLEAATKRYVDDTISGSAVSGVIAGAISSLLQVDLANNTDLLGTNNQLPLNNTTAVINGQDFMLNSNSITIKDEGLYQISWNVVANQSGTSAARRRNLVCDLNINNGASFPTGTLGGNYTRDSGSSPYINVGGDYVIETTSPNTTVGVRTRDLSTENDNGVVFEVAGGYLRVRLVRKTV